MTLRSVSSIEMAPDHYWNTYETPAGDITLRPDSTVMDALPSLGDVLSGELSLDLVLGDESNGGGEGRIYKLDEGEGAYAFKIPESSCDIYSERELVTLMGRYGGFCIEQALQGSHIDGVPLKTPRYEAMITDGARSSLIMSWEEGEELVELCSGRNFDWGTAVQLKGKIFDALLSSLSDIGVNGIRPRDTDVMRGRNVLVSTTDENVHDITAITLVDVIPTRNWKFSPKLWRPGEVSV